MDPADNGPPELGRGFFRIPQGCCQNIQRPESHSRPPKTTVPGMGLWLPEVYNLLDNWLKACMSHDRECISQSYLTGIFSSGLWRGAS